MIRRLPRLAVIGAVAGWLLDRRLADRARRAGEAGPPAIVSRVEIDAPIERVWEIVADVERQPTWMTDLRSVRLDPPGEVRVGARATGVVRILGLSVADPVTIIELEPPVRFAIRHDGTFRGDGVISLSAGRDGHPTQVAWHETLIAPVLPWAWAFAARPVLGRVFAADLARLRVLAEATAAV